MVTRAAQYPRIPRTNVAQLLVATAWIDIGSNPLNERQMLPRRYGDDDAPFRRICSFPVSGLKREAVHGIQNGYSVALAAETYLLLRLRKHAFREPKCVSEHPFNRDDQPARVVGCPGCQEIHIDGRASGAVPADRVSADEEVLDIASVERFEDFKLLVRYPQLAQ